jgi:hypothetical protein
VGGEIQNNVKKCMSSPSVRVLKLNLKIYSHYKKSDGKSDGIIWNYKIPVKLMTKTFYAITF